VRKLIYSLSLVFALALGPWRVYAQVPGDAAVVDDREFLRLLKRAKELNEEQKGRAKRTINPRILARLAEDEDPGVRFYVAFNPRTPGSSMLALAKDPNQTVRWAVASNERLMFRIDEKLQDYLSNNVISLELERAFGKNGTSIGPDATVEADVPGKVWKLTYEGKTYLIRKREGWLYVYNERLPDEILLNLAHDYLEIVRVGLASNQSTPPNILRELAADVSDAVRRSVAGNPNTEKIVLEVLSRDPVRKVRLTVTNNPRTPLRVMERFSIESDDSFRVAVATNLGTSPAILLGLIFDPEVTVRRAVAAHPEMPPPGLSKLAEDADRDVRYAVALNNATPPAGLRRLAFDRDRQIKSKARLRLSRILEEQIARDRER
jgi:hypothetical protein